MNAAPLELLAELVPTLAYALVAGALTVLGLLAEISGYSHLAAGDTVAAIWLELVGLLILYIGVYLVGYGELWKGRIRTSSDA